MNLFQANPKKVTIITPLFSTTLQDTPEALIIQKRCSSILEGEKWNEHA